MQFSSKPKIFSPFFLHFWNLHQISKIYKKRCASYPIYFRSYRLQNAWLLKGKEYPSKENKNALKIMQVLLYTYFYNISLNILRANFLNICSLPVSHFPNIRVKVRPKTIFSTLWAPAPTELEFLITFCHLYLANQETNKTVPAIFFFSNSFWIMYF